MSLTENVPHLFIVLCALIGELVDSQQVPPRSLQQWLKLDYTPKASGVFFKKNPHVLPSVRDSN